LPKINRTCIIAHRPVARDINNGTNAGRRAVIVDARRFIRRTVDAIRIPNDACPGVSVNKVWFAIRATTACGREIVRPSVERTNKSINAATNANKNARTRSWTRAILRSVGDIARAKVPSASASPAIIVTKVHASKWNSVRKSATLPNFTINAVVDASRRAATSVNRPKRVRRFATRPRVVAKKDSIAIDRNPENASERSIVCIAVGTKS
jgi:hypothetical protein